uniref:Ubiquitin-like protease family profile domain-containing protein n=1 Tax=Periophthalmus magnuspinnatus TaxID=409849 RepID=A0A3B4A736_9GOBI
MWKIPTTTGEMISFPPPPMKGGITVTMEDLQCLDSDQYLNDVIIDFYLKYLLQNASECVANRSHIFSSFFYKQLTRRDNNKTLDSFLQKRYQRVRTWTRHMDIFSKDFIFVPVNQEAHWYLVVICFPGLEEPKTETLSPGQDATNESDLTDSEKEDPPSDPNSVVRVFATNMILFLIFCLDLNFFLFFRLVLSRLAEEGLFARGERTQKPYAHIMPCILVMDSLKRSPHERVFKLMREYLQSEWEARRGSSREFGPDQMESSHCQVPLQDNSSDCGLYLLHYVESFLKDPIVHFELPLHLKFWFPRHQVRRKREEIRDLVLKLYRIQNMNVKT